MRRTQRQIFRRRPVPLYDELVEIKQENGEIRKGKVLEVNGDKAMVQLFEGTQGLKISTSKACFLGRSLELGVSEDMLGRVFNGMGEPIDGGAPIIAEMRLPVPLPDGQSVPQAEREAVRLRKTPAAFVRGQAY